MLVKLKTLACVRYKRKVWTVQVLGWGIIEVYISLIKKRKDVKRRLKLGQGLTIQVEILNVVLNSNPNSCPDSLRNDSRTSGGVGSGGQGKWAYIIELPGVGEIVRYGPYGTDIK